MAGSVNKVILVGNLGNDPEVRTMQNGGEVCNLSVATSDSWKDKNTGERREKTEWHRVVIFSPGLVTVCKNYLKKGAKVYLEGSVETRSWEQDGQKKYTTEIVLKAFDSKLVMLDGRSDGGGQGGGYIQNNNQGGGFGDSQNGDYNQAPQQSKNNAPAPVDDLEDEIPF